MSLRIAFCGASGTGKTTLARWAAETFGIPLNPVGSRSTSRDMGFDTPYAVDASGKRREFQHRLQFDKMNWENSRESFVTDRTTLDELAYTIMHDHEAVTENYLSMALLHMNRYTHVFYCPVDVFQDLAGDKDRKTDATYHRIFDMVLQGAMDRADDLGLGPTEVRQVMYDSTIEVRQQIIIDLTREDRK